MIYVEVSPKREQVASSDDNTANRGTMANSILSFKARLCLMGQGGELVPYDTTHIRAASEADAIRLSKQWAQDAAMSEILTCKFSRRIRASQSLPPGRVLTILGASGDLIGRDTTRGMFQRLDAPINSAQSSEGGVTMGTLLGQRMAEIDTVYALEVAGRPVLMFQAMYALCRASDGFARSSGSAFQRCAGLGWKSETDDPASQPD